MMVVLIRKWTRISGVLFCPASNICFKKYQFLHSLMNFHHHPHCVLTEEFRFFLDLDLCCNIVKKWPSCAWLFASQSTSLYFTLPLSFTSSTPTLPHTTPSSVSLLGFTLESVWLIHGLQAQMDCRWICCADGMSIYFAWVIMLMCFFFHVRFEASFSDDGAGTTSIKNRSFVAFPKSHCATRQLKKMCNSPLLR